MLAPKSTSASLGAISVKRTSRAPQSDTVTMWRRPSSTSDAAGAAVGSASQRISAGVWAGAGRLRKTVPPSLPRASSARACASSRSSSSHAMRIS